MVKNNSTARLLLVIIFTVTVIYFGYWGYEWVNYVLSKMFSVATGSTFFDLLVGLIAMIASVPLFVGGIMAWRDNNKGVDWLTVGAIGFMLKNVFEMANGVYKLTLVDQVTAYHIRETSSDIGQQLFQLAFWVFVMIYFKKLLTKGTTAPIVDAPIQ